MQPYSNQFNGGFSHQLVGDYAVHVDGVFTNTDHDRKILDINARVPGAATRPNTTFARVDRNQSTGSVRYRALYTKFEKRFSRRHQFMVTYTYMRSRDNDPLGALPRSVRSRSRLGSVERRAASRGRGERLGAVALRHHTRRGLDRPIAAAVERHRRPRYQCRRIQHRPRARARRRNAGSRTLDLAAVNAYRATNGRAAIPESQIESSRINLLDMRVSKAIRFGEHQARSDGAAVQRVEHDAICRRSTAAAA